jgi:hypothetical protein
LYLDGYVSTWVQESSVAHDTCFGAGGDTGFGAMFVGAGAMSEQSIKSVNCISYIRNAIPEL